ncbi:MAG: hypothetical protein ABJF89_10730 [Parasphingorhabdus sp.]|uniref:hypothetical protein n=1 Tax=Parasphingorhabdus sp. TaxID=2709688 RepID=UPI0032651574
MGKQQTGGANHGEDDFIAMKFLGKGNSEEQQPKNTYCQWHDRFVLPRTYCKRQQAYGQGQQHGKKMEFFRQGYERSQSGKQYQEQRETQTMQETKT